MELLSLKERRTSQGVHGQANPQSGVAGVIGSTALVQVAGAGSKPSAALQVPPFGPKDLVVQPVSATIARRLSEAKHYLGSYPGGASLNFGVFVGTHLLGIVVLGAGPANLHRFFDGALPQEVMCLARMWLDDRLGRNCESRTLGIILRHLRREQTIIKALVAYSDPQAWHSGIIYQASGFLYLGPSTAMPRYRLPNGSVHHSRSLSNTYGTHSLKYFESHGVRVEAIQQQPKHTYVTLIDPSWRDRLTRPVLPYPIGGNNATR